MYLQDQVEVESEYFKSAEECPNFYIYRSDRRFQNLNLKKQNTIFHIQDALNVFVLLAYHKPLIEGFVDIIQPLSTVISSDI